MKIKLTVGLFILLAVSNSYALKFHSFVNEKGETVYSNVPQECIRNAVLTCMDRHPAVLDSRKSDRRSYGTGTGSARFAGKNSNQQSSRRKTSNMDVDNQPSGASVTSAFGVLQNIVEMNKLMNEYYPAQADPADSAKVRAQQEDILDVLDIIRAASSNEEQGTIDKAIDILRSNLVE